MAKLASLLAVTCMLLSCSVQHGHNTEPALPTLAQRSATVDPVSWTTIDFVDLIKRVNASCVIDSPKLVRCAGPVHIDGLAQTSVVGHGIRVEFLDSRPGKGGIALVNAIDLRLSDLKIGWLSGGARDPILAGVQRLQSFGYVAACANREAGGVLSLDLPLEGMQPVNTVSIWDDALGWPWYRSAPDDFEINFPSDTATRFSKGLSECIPRLATLVGNRVLVRHIYTNHAFDCLHCKNVTVEGVTVTSAPGMAFVFEQGGSKLILRNNVVEPACSPRCQRPEPSVFGDGAHFGGIEGNVLLEGNDFGWNGDDSLNITGLLIPVHVEPQTGTLGSWVQVYEQLRGRLSLLALGEKILLFDRGLSARGEATILAVETSTGRLRISQLLSSTSDLVIAPEDAIPRNIVVRHNRFHDHRARGILIGGYDALLEDNDIERVTMEAILVPADTRGQNYEGPGAQHLTIRANRISDVNRYPALPDYPSAISAGVALSDGYVGKVGTPIRDIVVEGNSFVRVYSNAQVPVFFGKGVTDGRVK